MECRCCRTIKYRDLASGCDTTLKGGATKMGGDFHCQCLCHATKK
jgi:hypothetical protein